MIVTYCEAHSGPLYNESRSVVGMGFLSLLKIAPQTQFTQILYVYIFLYLFYKGLWRRFHFRCVFTALLLTDLRRKIPVNRVFPVHNAIQQFESKTFEPRDTKQFWI